MKCSELVVRGGAIVLCLAEASHVAVFDWSHAGCRMALCEAHAASPPRCLALMNLRPTGRLLRVV